MSKRRWVTLGLAVAMALGIIPAAAGTTAPATGEAGPQPERLPHRPEGRVEIPPAHLAALKAFLEEYLPGSLERIERLHKEDPQQARRQWSRLYRLWWSVRQYPPDVCKAAVSCHRLRGDIYETVRRIRRAESPAEKAALTKKLHELLGEHFDADMIVKEHLVRSLTKRLAELKAKVAERRKNRASLIEEHLAQVLQPPASRPAATQPARWRPWARHRKMTPQDEQKLVSFLKASAPALLAQLEKLRERHPADAERMLADLYRLWSRVRDYPGAVRDAVLARRRLNVAVERTVQELRKTESPREKAKHTRKLRDLLAEQFDHGQLINEYRVTRLAKQLDEVEAEITLRRRTRAEIIRDWQDRLLRPPVASQPAKAPAAASR